MMDLFVVFADDDDYEWSSRTVIDIYFSEAHAAEAVKILPSGGSDLSYEKYTVKDTPPKKVTFYAAKRHINFDRGEEHHFGETGEIIEVQEWDTFMRKGWPTEEVHISYVRPRWSVPDGRKLSSGRATISGTSLNKEWLEAEVEAALGRVERYIKRNNKPPKVA